ncbi:taste receptor type 1 member 1-like [Periophthalmus magnuspinnatus]|uniref:taste receptor type 1 member 1-like n=1 Tax=Periophthalmus magnuspinnatus TaxID=409849 RepID=UPI00145A84FE|nr:taste receptor type 1 member 1-like [Periophthalmus magnuspinnatus]
MKQHMCTKAGSEFRQSGDFVLGGLFDIHYISKAISHHMPESTQCSSHDLIVPSYRRFQIMRFAIEEINNSSTLLPNVTLGYEIFDHCSNTDNFPSVFKFISQDRWVQPWYHLSKGLSDVAAVVGPFSSSDTTTIAPLFMMDFVPLISYGAGSSAFSEKVKFPSFMRTVHSNRDLVEVVVHILLYFKWHWVAFLNTNDAYGKDGLELFRKRIVDTGICVAYNEVVNHHTNTSIMIKQLEAYNVNVIVVFVPEETAEYLIGALRHLNMTKKVWLAVDAWSLNKKLPKMQGIKNVGTVLGVAQPSVHIPGFKEFVYSTKKQCQRDAGELCNQHCPDCGDLTPEDIIRSDPSYSYNVYIAVYAIAHALHNMLQCGSGECQKNTTVHHYKVLAELRKSNFSLLHELIQFDTNSDPKFGSYAIVFWNCSGDAEEIGFYRFYPSVNFYIDTNKLQWHTGKETPISRCSLDCLVGYAKKQEGSHKCCFSCHKCPNGTYINVTADAYSCQACSAAEWSSDGSTSCILRTVEFVPFEDAVTIVIMVGTVILVALSLLTAVLFSLNFNTPVVRSAGGPMCFLILGCLSLCSISVFFYFGTPTFASCILRFFPFFMFFSVCLACFVVRSFQIVCIFKIAAKYPSVQRWWMKYHGQWLVITLSFLTQTALLILGYILSPPAPFSDYDWDQTKIILSCGGDFQANFAATILLLVLCCLCFIFSYMGKDLPKNYNEAKSITFCLLLIVLTWVIFATQFILYKGKYIQTLNAMAVLSSLYSFLLWYFLPKCYIIIFQPKRNTAQYFQGLIQSYTKTISQ